jgi:hypothetical protein
VRIKKMDDNWKITYRQIALLFGFLFFSLGILTTIQIGLLEGSLEVIPYSLIILLLGIIFLIGILIKKLEK